METDDGPVDGNGRASGNEPIALLCHRVGVCLHLYLEVDQRDGRWSHFSMHHDPGLYARRLTEIVSATEQALIACVRAGAPISLARQPTLAEHPRLGAFEVWAVVTSPHASSVPCLLHSKLNTSLFPSTNNLVRKIQLLVGLPTPPRTDGSYTRLDGALNHAPCASCGALNVRTHRVVDRFSYSHSHNNPTVKLDCEGTDYPPALNRHVYSPSYKNSLTRYGQRLLCEQCCRLCAKCGHRYVPSANHPHACLGKPNLPYGQGAAPHGFGASPGWDPPGWGGWPGGRFAWPEPAPVLVSRYSYAERLVGACTPHRSTPTCHVSGCARRCGLG
jgi:hypothetical protein